MAYEKEQAHGRYIILKKQIYELGIRAQSHVEGIRQETDTFLTENDFTKMDFKRIESLSRELQLLQGEYNDKVAQMKLLKDTYNISE